MRYYRFLTGRVCASRALQVQSNNRAELKAAIFALRFVHEVAKIGLPHNCSQIASDERPIEPRGFSVTVRSDSEYVVRGYNGRNNYKTHTDLWKNVRLGDLARPCIEPI